MNSSVSYACDEDEAYEKASATPVTTCTMKATSVALPKTYHQRASCGTRCFKLGPISAEMPSRSSSHRHDPIMSRFIASVTASLGRGFPYVATCRRWALLVRCCLDLRAFGLDLAVCGCAVS